MTIALSLPSSNATITGTGTYAPSSQILRSDFNNCQISNTNPRIRLSFQKCAFMYRMRNLKDEKIYVYSLFFLEDAKLFITDMNLRRNSISFSMFLVFIRRQQK
jgi:hypothetical protein